MHLLVLAPCDISPSYSLNLPMSYDLNQKKENNNEVEP